MNIPPALVELYQQAEKRFAKREWGRAKYFYDRVQEALEGLSPTDQEFVLHVESRWQVADQRERATQLEDTAERSGFRGEVVRDCLKSLTIISEQSPDDEVVKYVGKKLTRKLKQGLQKEAQRRLDEIEDRPPPAPSDRVPVIRASLESVGNILAELAALANNDPTTQELEARHSRVCSEYLPSGDQALLDRLAEEYYSDAAILARVVPDHHERLKRALDAANRAAPARDGAFPSLVEAVRREFGEAKSACEARLSAIGGDLQTLNAWEWPRALGRHKNEIAEAAQHFTVVHNIAELEPFLKTIATAREGREKWIVTARVEKQTTLEALDAQIQKTESPHEIIQRRSQLSRLDPAEHPRTFEEQMQACREALRRHEDETIDAHKRQQEIAAELKTILDLAIGAGIVSPSAQCVQFSNRFEPLEPSSQDVEKAVGAIRDIKTAIAAWCNAARAECSKALEAEISDLDSRFVASMRQELRRQPASPAEQIKFGGYCRRLHADLPRLALTSRQCSRFLRSVWLESDVEAQRPGDPERIVDALSAARRALAARRAVEEKLGELSRTTTVDVSVWAAEVSELLGAATRCAESSEAIHRNLLLLANEHREQAIACPVSMLSEEERRSRDECFRSLSTQTEDLTPQQIRAFCADALRVRNRLHELFDQAVLTIGEDASRTIRDVSEALLRARERISWEQLEDRDRAAEFVEAVDRCSALYGDISRMMRESARDRSLIATTAANLRQAREQVERRRREWWPASTLPQPQSAWTLFESKIRREAAKGRGPRRRAVERARRRVPVGWEELGDLRADEIDRMPSLPEPWWQRGIRLLLRWCYRYRWHAATASIVVVLVASGAWWWSHRSPAKVEPVPIEPGKPVTVMPHGSRSWIYGKSLPDLRLSVYVDGEEVSTQALPGDVVYPQGHECEVRLEWNGGSTAARHVTISDGRSLQALVATSLADQRVPSERVERVDAAVRQWIEGIVGSQ